jgi:UDP-glucose 4-epimerase
MTLPLPDLSAFADRQCVVTGGLGFIGSNMALALAAHDAHVTVIDALVPQHGGDRTNLDQSVLPGRPIALIEADIADSEHVMPAVHGAAYVFNVAGQVSHLESMTDPMRDLDINARAHLAFLESVRLAGDEPRIVQTSTRQVYGRPRYLPVDEEHPTQPVDVNGVGKLAGEQLHLIYARVHDMRTSALRLTNVFGPRQCLSKDGLGFLPVFVRQALRNETIRIYGDGSQMRDVLHVNDVISGLALAVLSDDAPGEVFNLGHPAPLTLREIAEELLRQTGRGDIEFIPWPDDHARIDIGSFAGDFSKATRVLGWEPAVSFADAVTDTLAFFSARPKR